MSTVSIVLPVSVTAPGAPVWNPTHDGTTTGFPARNLAALYLLNDTAPQTSAVDYMGGTAMTPYANTGTATKATNGGVTLAGTICLPKATAINLANPWTAVAAIQMATPNANDIRVLMCSKQYALNGIMVFYRAGGSPVSTGNIPLELFRSVDGAQGSGQSITPVSASGYKYNMSVIAAMSHDGAGTFACEIVRASAVALTKSRNIIAEGGTLLEMEGAVGAKTTDFFPAAGGMLYQGSLLTVEAFAVYTKRLTLTELIQCNTAGAAIGALRGRLWT